MSEPMIDKLERLLAESTPGPWDAVEGVRSHLLLRVVTPDLPSSTKGYLGSTEDYANAALIVAMRNALPAILSDYRVMREALERILAESLDALDHGEEDETYCYGNHVHVVREARSTLASLSSPQEDTDPHTDTPNQGDEP